MLISVNAVRAGLWPVLVFIFVAFAQALRADDEAPSITGQPVSLTVTQATDATFIIMTAGTEPLTYQWFLNETNSITDATNATLTILGAQSTDAGFYTVQVSNAAGSVLSDAATLTVLVPAAITQQPVSLVVTQGDAATFSVTAIGTEPINYQWSHGAMELAGETNATLTIASAQTAHAGNYAVQVSNAAGIVLSDAATLTVLVPVAITQQPVSLVVTQGDAATFSVTAIGTEPISYQWSHGAMELAGETNATLTIASAQTAHAGTYTVQVSNAAGIVLSDAATLTVLVPAAITQQPVSLVVTQGNAATFSVTAIGTEPISYQWSHGAMELAGETNATLTIASAQTAHAGNYAVQVSNVAGSMLSDAATLMVLVPVAITQQPVSLVVTQGNAATFSATAIGTEPISYQWSHGAMELAGETNATLTIASAQTAHAGTYTVQVSNAAGSALSDAATLTVLVPAAITQQPVSLVVTQGNAATFSVTASGTEPISYQWSHGAMVLTGETNATLTIASAQTAHAGTYTVQVSNAAGIVLSDAATLTVLVPAAIAQQPVSLVVTQGDAATFSVTASGTEPISYQWSHGAMVLTGETNATLTIASAQTAHAGTYTVQVSNAAGIVLSDAATLTVLVPAAITQQPVSLVVTQGNAATFSVTANGTEPISYQWRHGAMVLAGETNATLTIASAQTAHAGTYTVQVSNAAGIVLSDAATLTVMVPAAITQQPVSLVVTQGNAATFSVTANGTEPISYQWRHGAMVLTGETNATLTIASAQTAHAGSYTVQVSNAAGIVLSDAATLTVLVSAAITQQPVSLVVTQGNAATFSVTAIGTEPISYQWRHGAMVLAGETNATLTIASAQTAHAGSYTVQVSNAAGIVLSDAATLTVLVPAAITQQPVSLVVTQGNAATFSVTAIGTEPISYQWRHGAMVLAGETNATLTIASAQTAHAGTYTVQVSNAAGSVLSDAATLTVLVPAAITQQPLSLVVTQGNGATFSVTAIGTEPISYQWRHGAMVLAGETNATLTIANAQTAHAGTYTVQVNNAAGSVLSDAATLTVLVPAAITQQPVSLVVTQGNAATFSVTAIGTEPISYQWRHAAMVLAGETNATLTIASAQTAHAGTYTVQVSNAAGIVLSDAATLTVLVPAAITQQPVSLVVTQGNAATFSVTASGTEPISYQWRHGAIVLTGETNATLTIASAQTVHAGTYTVQVSNVAGSVLSDAATLTVLVPPAITQQPQSLSVSNGFPATFTVGASGTAPLSYQWRRNGVDLPGATGSQLTIPSVQPASAGDYSVVVANSAGSLASAVVKLTVLGPATIIAQPQSLVRTNGNEAVFRVEAAGSPVIRYQWRFNGGNIPGETNRVLTLGNVTTNNAGAYTVVVGNGLSGNGGGEGGTGLLHNLISYWKLDEPGGTRFDAHGTNHLAEITPMDSAPGKLGPAGRFVSGASNYLAHPHNQDLAVTGNTPFTFSCWTWFDAKDDYKGFVLKRLTVEAESTEYQLYYSTIYDRMRFGISDGVNVAHAEANSLGSPEVSTWYHVVFWYDPEAQTVNIQVNDGPVDSTFWPFGTQTTTGDFSLGRTIPGYYYLDGRIDGVGFWKRLLTAAERTALYNGGAGMEYPFDAGAPSPLPPPPDSGSVTSVVATLTVLVPPSILASPQSRTNVIGTTATFSVTASGTAPLHYQWFFNETNQIAGATNSTLTLANVQGSDAGTYRVQVSNGAGTVTSGVGILAVSFDPVFTQQPQSLTVFSGESATFGSSAIGAPPLGYQWRFNGANLAGATNATLTINPAQMVNAGNYSVVAGNPSGAVTSLTAVLTVFVPPVITKNPDSLVLTNHGEGAFSVLATGLGPLTYQWRLNGAALSGVTNRVLSLTNVTTAQAGDYSVVVQNNPGATPRLLDGLVSYWKLDEAGGTRLDSHGLNPLTDGNGVGQIAGKLGPAARFIGTNHTILSHPANSDLTLGSDTPFTFSCWVYMNNKSDYMGFILKRMTIEGKNTEYQVYYDDAADRFSLSLTEGVHLGHVEANAPGSPAINTWHLITAWHDPVGDTINIQVNNGPVDSAPWAYGTMGTSAPFTLGQTVPGFYYLDGRLDGVGFWKRVLTANERAELFNGGSGVEYPFMSTSQGASLLATNDFSSVTSTVATLTVLLPPSITTPPQSRTNFTGTTASFSVTLSGDLPLNCQWYFNGTTPLPGATNVTLVLTNVQPGQAGAYSVRVSNVVGAVESLGAGLTVAGPPVITQQPQSLTVDPGATAHFNVTVSGVGPMTYQWRYNGTPLPGATSAALSILNVHSNDSGSYSVIVTNPAGAVISAAAGLTVTGPILLSGAQIPVSGKFQFMLDASAGRNYLIETSTNLLNWTELTTLTNTTGLMPFNDAGAANYRQRFYRARALP